MLMLGRLTLSGACQGDVEALPVGTVPQLPLCKVPFLSVRGCGLAYIHIPHICPHCSTPQRLPWELFLRGGGWRLRGGSAGRCWVFKWCLIPIHTMLFPFCGRGSIFLFSGMRLEGPCLVGGCRGAKYRDNRDTAHLSCRVGWFGSGATSAVLLWGHRWGSGRSSGSETTHVPTGCLSVPGVRFPHPL